MFGAGRGAGEIGRTNGFDYLRLILSVGVVVSHTVLSSYGLTAQAALSASPLGILNRLILPMFFALSGYLVAGSLFRCRSLVSFVGLRLFRLVPALAMEVTLSALLLGPMLTDLRLGEYFRNGEFHRYFFNIIGIIHYTLPGVFRNNPYPDVVNVQLWTIPWELHCYVGLVALVAIGIAPRRLAMVAVLVATQIVLLVYVATKIVNSIPSPNGSSGPVLFTSFFAGYVLFLYRERIPWSGGWLAAAGLASLALEALPFGNYLVAVPSAYVTVALGRMNPPKVFPVSKGDYSYGIYLYGLPVQQAIAACGPSFQHWYVSLLLGLPLIVAVAALSWHLVEKPILERRALIGSAEEAWLFWKRRTFTGRRLWLPPSRNT